MIDKDTLQGVLHTWREHVLPAADARLQHLFSSAGEVLFEYAEKAESNEVQTVFIDGRREFSVKQEEVRQLFQERLQHKLFDCLRSSERPIALGAETLSLVSKDSFERSLALQTISDQAIEKHRDLYHALSLRLGVVTGGGPVEYEALPAGPHQLAGVFEYAANPLQVKRQVLLALFTLFEHEVIRVSPEWHEDLNETLREQGILPNIAYQVKRYPDSPSAEVPTKPATDDANFVASHTVSGLPRWDSSRETGPARHDGLQNTRSAASGGASATRIQNTGGISDPAPRHAPGVGTGADGPATPRPAPYARKATTGSMGNPAQPTGNNPQLGEQMLGRIRGLLSARRASLAGSGAARPDPINPASAATVAAAIQNPQVTEAAPAPETGTLQQGVQQIQVSRELLLRITAALRAQRKKIRELVGDDKLSHFDEDTIEIVGLLFEEMLGDELLGNVAKALLSRLHTPFLKVAVRDPEFLTRRDHPARHLFDNVIEAASRWVDEKDLTQGIYPRLQRVVNLIVTTKELSTSLLQELDEGLTAEIELRSQRQQAREAKTVESEQGREKLEQAKAMAAKTLAPLMATANTPQLLCDFLSGPWADYLTLVHLRSNGQLDGASWLDAVRLARELRNLVASRLQGVMPADAEITNLHRAIDHCLGDAVPHLQAQIDRVFSLFDSSQEVTLATPRSTPPAPPTQLDEAPLGDSGKELLKRLPTLPSGTWVVFKNHGAADQPVKLSWFNDRTERFLFVDQAGAKALVVPLRKLAGKIDSGQARVLLTTNVSYVESSLQRALHKLKKQA